MMSLRSIKNLGLAAVLASAFLGNVMGEEPAAAKTAAPLRTRFAELDSDNDRQIGSSEIPVNGQAAFNTLLKYGDRDHDGMLSAREYRDLLQRANQSRKEAAAEKPAQPTAAKNAAPLRARIRAMDSNGDDRISRTEFTGFPALFKRRDVNKDGFLDQRDRR